jgi:hypothetical protein
LRKRNWQAIADPSIGQQQMFVLGLHADRREQTRNRRACTNDVAHANTVIASRREAAWSAALQVVAHDTNASNTVMQPVERGAFELLETRRNYSASSPQNPIEPASETNVQTVGEEMTSAKCLCVADQFIERESDRGIVSGDNCAGARANEDIDGNGVGDELLKDADMTCAA